MNRFHTLRNTLINDLLLALVIVGAPAVALSITRAQTIGFRPFMLVQIFAVALLLLTWILRSKISYTIRAASLMTLLAVVTFFSLARLGPVADTKVLLVVFAFCAMLFFRAVVAWFLISGVVIGVALIGFAATRNWLRFELDYQSYAHNATTWLTTLWTMGFFSIAMGYIGWRMVHGLNNQSKEYAELAHRLQRISERIPGMIYQFKLYADGRSSIPYSSDAIREIFRVGPEQVRDDASAAFAAIHPDDLERVQASIRISGDQLTPWRLEFRIAYTDGTLRWLDGNALPQREPDGSVLWHGFITDITERKKTEQLKDEFIATVSHELRTPLTAIRGAIKLVTSGTFDNKLPEKEEMLKMADQNSERLLFLINDLLDIEKLERGGVYLHMSSIDAKEFISECIGEIFPFALQHHTAIVLQDCDEVIFVADRQRIKQVVTNLLSNACKFSPPHSIVEVKVGRKGDNLEIQVRDHGGGIPLDFQDKIFEKFMQADASDRRVVGGTGLGLAIVKKIVDLHHGRVYFESSATQGTCFYVELPI